MTNFVSNFQNFAVLGICLTIGVVTGLGDNTGLFTTAIRMALGYASILPGSAEVFLTPLINESAHMMDPGYNMSILGSYFFLFVSAFLVAGACTFVTVKIVEPRLGAYSRPGMGTIFSNMLPYTITLFLVFVVQLVLWMVLNLPVGVGAGVWL